MTGSRPSRPCLRAVWLHSTIFLIRSARCTCGGLKIHGRMPSARFITPRGVCTKIAATVPTTTIMNRSEEHTSELQSRRDLVCRLLLEKKKNKNNESKQQTTTQSNPPLLPFHL